MECVQLVNFGTHINGYVFEASKISGDQLDERHCDGVFAKPCGGTRYKDCCSDCDLAAKRDAKLTGSLIRLAI